MNRSIFSGLSLLLVGATLLPMAPAEASNWGARREYREGIREIARERREMRNSIMNSSSRAEARREYREGMREIGRERREMRREIGREIRHGQWQDERDDGARLIAGVLLGAVVVAAVRGQEPEPPAPDLCWYWSDSSGERGYWDRCGSN